MYNLLIKGVYIMGGKLFPTNERIESKEEFYSLFNKQKQLLKPITKDVFIPRQIESKTSFGDLDILLPEDHLYAVVELLESLNYPISLLRNPETGEITHNMVSYQYDNKQVDLIFIPKDSLEFSINYFSYGDQGGLLSTLVKKFSLKNSFLGFYFRYVRNDSSYQKDILISLDYDKVLDILELDKDKFHSGFKTNEELFEWVVTSPFFDSSLYPLESLSNKNRFRNKKRAFYKEFLDYLDTKPPVQSTKTVKLNFEDFKQRYIECEKEFERTQKYRNKYNGFLVSKLTGLEEKELGLFMKAFKNSYSKDEIINMSDEELEQRILNYKMV